MRADKERRALFSRKFNVQLKNNMFKKITFKNGLRIITVSQKNTQAVTVLVLAGTGSKYETKEINGISHFLEHMYFKGTKKRPSALAVAETLDGLGGIYNAFTGEEYTGYFAKVAALHLDTALEWASDIYLNSLLPEKEIKKEKGVIIEEINMYHDHPMAYIGVLWTKLLYGDQPAGWEIAGQKENIIKMTRKKLLDYRKNQYVASNTILSIAGNFDEKETLAKVKKYFAKIAFQKPKGKTPVVDASISLSIPSILKSSGLKGNPESCRRVEKQDSPQILLQQRKTDQTHLALGVRAFNLFHPQRYAQEILSIILGGMMSSRLFTEIRSKLGIAYYIKTDVEANPDTGYLVTLAGIDNKNVDKAISIILREYKRLCREKIPEKELKKAKDYLKGKMILELEPSDAKASFFAGQELLEKRISEPKEIFEKIDRISTNDILKLARTIFQPEKLNLALIGPFEDKEKFQRLLRL